MCVEIKKCAIIRVKKIKQFRGKKWQKVKKQYVHAII